MRKTPEPKAGSVEWWLANDVPEAVPFSELGEEPDNDGLTRRQRDKQFRRVRPGRRYIPDLTYEERVAEDDETAWQPDDFEPDDFEAPTFRDWGSPDDTPANWENDLDTTACESGCGRVKAPNRRRCWACIKVQQRQRDAILSRSRAKSRAAR
jgi:hypothetical protein